ncbi:hypothetical protein ACP70R_004318 [Stipagrostis hirtigluma subsp. patula]
MERLPFADARPSALRPSVRLPSHRGPLPPIPPPCRALPIFLAIASPHPTPPCRILLFSTAAKEAAQPRMSGRRRWDSRTSVSALLSACKVLRASLDEIPQSTMKRRRLLREAAITDAAFELRFVFALWLISLLL